MMDLQQWVPCLQQDNTDIRPQCSTLYNCGLTVLDAPRGHIMKLQVIDKINPDTHLEDADAADDYCAAITYSQVDPCYVRNYLHLSHSNGCCLPILPFFGLITQCAHYPTPTDEGLPPGLPPLPLGYHYPQGSTDRANGRRSHAGVWAIERGKIYIAPWIQSTESVLITWDGLKRSWSDGDLMDEDPMLAKAVFEYVRWQHASKYDHDPVDAADAQAAFIQARIELIRECREETRVRECEQGTKGSQARSSAGTIQSLYYNDTPGIGNASCPTGETGDDTTYRVEVGTVSSTISVADANQIAQEQAQQQAEAMLDCEEETVTYTNTVAGDYTAACEGEPDAPAPTGTPIRVVKPVGTVSGATVAEANALAQEQAEAEAIAQLPGHCTFYNRAKSATAVCSFNDAITAVGNVNESEFSANSQAAADLLAETEAASRAQAALDALGTCAAAPPGEWNDEQTGIVWVGCVPIGTVQVDWTAPAGFVFSDTKAHANQVAHNTATGIANAQAVMYCQMHQVGRYDLVLPESPLYTP